MVVRAEVEFPAESPGQLAYDDAYEYEYVSAQEYEDYANAPDEVVLGGFPLGRGVFLPPVGSSARTVVFSPLFVRLLCTYTIPLPRRGNNTILASHVCCGG